MDKNIDNLISYYDKGNNQKYILNMKDEIEKILEKFLGDLESSKEMTKKFSTGISSRIKSSDSLKEKIKRKDYMKEWGLDEKTSKEEFFKTIMEKLPDLIGFRINCYFVEDEKNVFDKLTTYLKENSNFIIEDSTNNRMKNGQIIYKLAGKYSKEGDTISFEIQVKSYLLGVWGEVEHKLIYKKEHYDSRIDLKTKLINEMYGVLGGVDRQLRSIFQDNIGISQVKEELFYLYSREDMKDYNNSLGEHYINFFKLSKLIYSYEKSRNHYLSKKIINEEFEKIIIEVKDTELDKKYEDYIDKYKLSMVYNIACVLYKIENEKIFLNHLIQELKERQTIDEEDESIDIETERENILLSLECIVKDKYRK